MPCVVAGASSLARAELLGICPVQWAHKAQERKERPEKKVRPERRARAFLTGRGFDRKKTRLLDRQTDFE